MRRQQDYPGQVGKVNFSRDIYRANERKPASEKSKEKTVKQYVKWKKKDLFACPKMLSTYCEIWYALELATKTALLRGSPQ